MGKYNKIKHATIEILAISPNNNFEDFNLIEIV
jgi:hypothetical protein